MEKFNNILNREEYLKAVNEGRIGDFIRGGVKKIRNAFSFMAKKVKKLIVMFDRNGNVLPVVSPQALGDIYKGDGNIRFFGTPEMDTEIRDMGGAGCDTDARARAESSYTDDAPNGQMEYFNWVKNGGYKDTNYYKNLQAMNGLFESLSINTGNEVNEKLTNAQRIPYSGKSSSVKTGTGIYDTITADEFKSLISERIKRFCENPESDRKPGNLLVFGAPGVGKSTIPKAVVEEYNRNRQPKDRISLIAVNCSRLEAGDLMMPSFPKTRNVMDIINNSGSDFSEILSFINMLPDERKNAVTKIIANSGQWTANNAPAPWLPCYRETGDKDADRILDMYANGGIFIMNENEKKVLDKFRSQANDGAGKTYDNKGEMKAGKVNGSENTGAGGIILLDEFLRCDPRIFKQLLTFLLDRKFEDYRLGSRWFIMACSNRPCDSNEVEMNFDNWESADKDRWPATFNYKPDPEEWKNWAREKGFDENLLKFIFDERSDGNLVDGEYTRWHSMATAKSIKNVEHKEISPRTWMKVHDYFMMFAEDHNDEERFKNGFSTSRMTLDEIDGVLKNAGVVEEFRNEICQWFENYCNAIDIESIIKDPVNTPMPITGNGMAKTNSKKKIHEGKVYEGKAHEGEQSNNVVVMQNLYDAMEERYKGDKKKNITDDELSQIMTWIGINYKSDFNVVSMEFAYRLKDLGIHIWDYHKFGLMFMAAFPENDYMEVAEYEGLKEALCDKKHGKNTKFFLKKTDNIADVAKGFAKRYFPWRVDGDEFVTIYGMDTDEKNEE
jgi:MoxR-like ATPase